MGPHPRAGQVSEGAAGGQAAGGRMGPHPRAGQVSEGAAGGQAAGGRMGPRPRALPAKGILLSPSCTSARVDGTPDHEVRSCPAASRFLIRIEEGYPSNPYHCRTHAADVLRSLHVVLNRGGVMTAVTAASGRSQPHEENRRQSITEGFASQVHSVTSSHAYILSDDYVHTIFPQLCEFDHGGELCRRTLL